MRNVKNDPPPPPGRRGAGREAEGAGAGQRPRGTPPPPAPRGPQPRRAARPGDTRLRETARAAHGSRGAARQPASPRSCPPAAAASLKEEKWRRPRTSPHARGTHLRLAEKASRCRRGNGPAFPTAALHRRARRTARENPDGSAGGRAPPRRPEGRLRARRESDAGAGAAGSAHAHWRSLLTDVRFALSPQLVGAHPDPTGR